MHPALSVIFFSVLSGAGYGVLMLVGTQLAFDPTPARPLAVVALLAFALLLVTVGLLASLAHLGRPERAWRALSQWRSSWLSREGVAAVACYLPALGVAALLLLRGDDGAAVAMRIAAAATALLALLTVVCTAMIYASIKAVPAWRDWRVLPVYLGLAAANGAAWVGAAGALAGTPPPPQALIALVLLLMLLVVLKLGHWRRLDADDDPGGTGIATGLAPLGRVRSFEAPHTERNFLMREMGFVLARRHATVLRALALLAIGGVPMLLLALLAWWPVATTVALGVAAPVLLLGTFVERWLFFAQARHLVMRYYGGDAPGDPLRGNA